MTERKRIRAWFSPSGETGRRNAITDVPGVKVGHYTIHEGDLHTGITLIQPHNLDAYQYPVPCAIYSGNGFGKLAGSLQVEELGLLETMIGLTNTLSVPMLMQGLLEHYIDTNKEIRSINIVAGETNDSLLNDIAKLAIKPIHVREAINNLSSEVEEGAVGAGAGTCCFGYKGGIGTASRIIRFSDTEQSYTIGALVQTNFSGNLNIYGRPFPNGKIEKPQDGSCMIIIATDAPLDARQLKRLAKRGIIGMTQTGSYMANGSGDFCIAFSNFKTNSTHRSNHDIKTMTILPDIQINTLFEAACEAVREAVYNSLCMAETISGKGGLTVYALDLDIIQPLV
jgi:D-aminopeptidase